MSRQILRPVKVWTDAKGRPKQFVWRETIYTGRVVHSWNLSTYWWEPDKCALYDHGLSDQTIADLIAATQGTVNKIRHGHQSGRNLERRLRRVYETINRNFAEAGIS
jgi:hypothetical protein